VSFPPSKPPQKPGGPSRPGLAPAAKGEDALARARREKDALEGECQSVEEELEALKARYEQYFLGVERREPNHWREDVKKKVLRLKGAFTRNTGLRFRLQSLNARYLSYERLWMRSAREKEEGTYRRDLFKARLRAKRDEGAAPSPAAAPAPPAAAAADAPAAPPRAAEAPAPVAAVKPASSRPPAPTPTPAPGAMSDAQMRALYDAYRAAKMTCREDVSRLTYEAVAKTVSKQIPELLTRYKARSVEFKVEVKDGRAILKAIPKV
jgi:hypothetical protein